MSSDDNSDDEMPVRRGRSGNVTFHDDDDQPQPVGEDNYPGKRLLNKEEDEEEEEPPVRRGRSGNVTFMDEEPLPMDKENITGKHLSDEEENEEDFPVRRGRSGIVTFSKNDDYSVPQVISEDLEEYVSDNGVGSEPEEELPRRSRSGNVTFSEKPDEYSEPDPLPQPEKSTEEFLDEPEDADDFPSRRSRSGNIIIEVDSASESSDSDDRTQTLLASTQVTKLIPHSDDDSDRSTTIVAPLIAESQIMSKTVEHQNAPQTAETYSALETLEPESVPNNKNEETVGEFRGRGRTAPVEIVVDNEPEISKEALSFVVSEDAVVSEAAPETAEEVVPEIREVLSITETAVSVEQTFDDAVVMQTNEELIDNIGVNEKTISETDCESDSDLELLRRRGRSENVQLEDTEFTEDNPVSTEEPRKSDTDESNSHIVASNQQLIVSPENNEQLDQSASGYVSEDEQPRGRSTNVIFEDTSEAHKPNQAEDEVNSGVSDLSDDKNSFEFINAEELSNKSEPLPVTTTDETPRVTVQEERFPAESETLQEETTNGNIESVTKENTVEIVIHRGTIHESDETPTHEEVTHAVWESDPVHYLHPEWDSRATATSDDLTPHQSSDDEDKSSSSASTFIEEEFTVEDNPVEYHPPMPKPTCPTTCQMEEVSKFPVIDEVSTSKEASFASFANSTSTASVDKFFINKQNEAQNEHLLDQYVNMMMDHGLLSDDTRTELMERSNDSGGLELKITTAGITENVGESSILPDQTAVIPKTTLTSVSGKSKDSSNSSECESTGTAGSREKKKKLTKRRKKSKGVLSTSPELPNKLDAQSPIINDEIVTEDNENLHTGLKDNKNAEGSLEKSNFEKSMEYEKLKTAILNNAATTDAIPPAKTTPPKQDSGCCTIL